MGEISSGDTSNIDNDLLSWSKELILVEPYPEATPFANFCGDIVMGSATPSIGHTDPIC